MIYRMRITLFGTKRKTSALQLLINLWQAQDQWCELLPEGHSVLKQQSLFLPYDICGSAQPAILRLPAWFVLFQQRTCDEEIVEIAPPGMEFGLLVREKEKY